MRIIAKTGIVTASFLVMVVSGMPALAFGAASAHANAQATQQTTTTGQPSEPGSQAADRKASAQTKLADAKLKACQKREKAINNIMSRVSDRGHKQLALFTSIATKTEAFYADKGKTLSDYDALVSDVTAKKAAAQTAVDAVKGESVTFKCDGTDPKGAAASFKEALKSEITALKDYKTSVKNLIVGVKSVQGATTSADNKTTGGN
jgi:phosphotransferase system HPr-like phosphotransfer protein